LPASGRKSHQRLPLRSYFAGNGFKAGKIEEYTHKDLGDVVEVNRFLGLFSMPSDQRPQMHQVDHTPVVLQLPKGSQIRAQTNSGFGIETKRMYMRVGVTAGVRKSDLPSDFRRVYLGLDEMTKSKTHTLGVSINVTISFRLRAFLSRTGWDYYRWVDSFFDKLEGDFSEAKFFEKIGREKASIIIESTTKHTQREQRRLGSRRESKDLLRNREANQLVTRISPISRREQWRYK
jgi:hypothetical protein